MERGLFFGNSGPCRVQLIRRLVGLADRLLQLRRSTFLLGELQTGGWTAICRRTLPVGFAAVPPLFLLRLPDTPVVQMVEGSPRQRRGIAGGGIVLLRRAV